MRDLWTLRLSLLPHCKKLMASFQILNSLSMKHDVLHSVRRICQVSRMNSVKVWMWLYISYILALLLYVQYIKWMLAQNCTRHVMTWKYLLINVQKCNLLHLYFERMNECDASQLAVIPLCTVCSSQMTDGVWLCVSKFVWCSASMYCMWRMHTRAIPCQVRTHTYTFFSLIMLYVTTLINILLSQNMFWFN